MKFVANPIYILVFVLSVFVLNSCKKENMCDCFKGTGKEIKEDRILPAFDKLFIEDRFEVYLKEDSEFSVQIEGGEHVLPLVKTRVENGILKISNDNKCNIVRSYKRRIKVYVTAPKFSDINQSGVGNIYTIGALQTDTITYRILSSGDVFLNLNNKLLIGGINGMGDFHGSGKTIRHICKVNGEAWVDCRNLQTDISDLYMRTSGSTFIDVSQLLNVIIKHSGNVYYNGNPSQINQQIDGTGKLIQGF